MKTYIKGGLLAAGALALVSFGMSVFLVRSLLRTIPPDEKTNAPKYHFVLYLPDARNDYFARIVAGAKRAAADCNSVLSVHTVDFAGNGLRMAEWTGSDGIAVCPDANDANVRTNLELLRADGPPVVLVNHNITAEQPWPFIGTNNFEFGKKAGTVVAGGTESGIRLAVVYSDKNPAVYAERELVEMGINGVVGKRMLATVTALKTDTNPQSAERVVYQLVRTMPEITTIVFTDNNDTLVGTQALIDLNLVGRVQIVGFGSDNQILAFIRKGIITATLVIEPDRIGYRAIRSLAELRESGYTSTSVDTGITVIRGDDL